MTARVAIGITLWLLASAHLIAVLLVPFLPVEQTAGLWKGLFAPTLVTAVIAFYGAHLIREHGRFWTVHRLLGMSSLLIGAAFCITVAATWRGADGFMEGPRTGLLLVSTGIIFGPLGIAGLVLLITGTQKEEHE